MPMYKMQAHTHVHVVCANAHHVLVEARCVGREAELEQRRPAHLHVGGVACLAVTDSLGTISDRLALRSKQVSK